jgi:PAS domain S-box-containing protein
MRIHLRDLPIKRKLMLVILLTSSFALLLMGSALITYELVTFRRTLAADMGVLANIVGSNSTAALAFQDRKNAQEILAALSAEAQITAAAIYDETGTIFARFPADIPLQDLPAKPEADGHRFTPQHLLLFRPITLEGARLGTIFLQADLGAMYRRISVYGTLLLAVGACSFFGTMALSALLQRRISSPVLELAKVAKAVSDRHDYSVRGIKHGEDEIGQLTEAFNQMLTRVGESNAALTASEERLRLALEGSQTGTWDMNLQTGRLFWDDYMFGLYGRTREEFDGTFEGALRFVHPDDQAAFTQSVQRALQEKRDLDVGFRIVDADGKVRHMATRGRAFYDATGKAIRMTGVSMDVTATKKTEEDLNAAKELAEAANKSKDNFLAVLSHELRTPLTPVLATVAVLEDDETLPPHVAHDVELIRRNVEVEARLIDDLLDVTRIARGKLELHRQVVDVRPLLEHAMKNYCGRIAAQKDLRVSVDVAAQETHVFADSSRLTQVFWNLLQNACKFTPQRGAIDVRVYNEPHRNGTNGSANNSDAHPDLVVEVADTGIGISDESLPRIFDAFEQGERSRTRQFGGLGLGLAISRAIVDLHGGALTAHSEGKDKGAKLVVRLQTVAAGAAAARSEPPPVPGAAGPVRALRILLVEDHADTADQLTRLLARAGHSVCRAGDISEAYKCLADGGTADSTCPFDLLVSDLGLPDGSGHDLMRDLKLRYSLRGIALSGYGMKDDIQKSMDAGFSRHITKPVDWEELQTAIQRLAQEPAPQQVESTGA